MLPQMSRRAEIGWKKQFFVQPERKVDREEVEKLRRRAPRQAELLDAISKLETPIRAADLLRQTALETKHCARWSNAASRSCASKQWCATRTPTNNSLRRRTSF